MNQLTSDLRSGVRLLVRYPTLSLIAVATLGLGIGLGTTVFSVVNGALFKGLPFPDADRLVAVVATNPSQQQPRQRISSQDLEVWQARQTAFEQFGAYTLAPVNLAAEGVRPERVSGGQLTVAAFSALGVQPMLGRGFQDGDDRPGAEPVILIAEQLWRDKYAHSPAIVGTSIRANGTYRTVIGVMPARFGFPIREQVWTPLTIEPRAAPRGQGPTYQVIARLKPGVSVREAQVEAGTIASQLARDFPATNRGIGADVMPYAKSVFGPEVFGVLYTMLAAGIGVLLIACVNVSNLLFARGSLRRREVAVRMTLGAGRTRVLRQQLTEVLVLAARGHQLIVLIMRTSVLQLAIGLAIGLALALAASGLLQPILYHVNPRDPAVFAGVIATLTAASLSASFLPALRATRINPASALAGE